MPKRSNDFQRLVYLVRVNLSEGAEVIESMMMRDRVTKRYREVDIVIKGTVGTHPVIVSIECRDHKRVADVTWVDMMKTKHERLDTNALLLASRSGFTPEARNVACSYGIEVFTLEDLDTADLSPMLGSNGSLWMKTFVINPQKITAKVPSMAELPPETVATNPDTLIHLEDGAVLCSIQEQVERLLGSDWVRDYMFSEAQREHAWFELIWEPPSNHDGRPLHLKKLEPEVLRPINSLRIWSSCKVEISQFGMQHGRLGNIKVAWGKTIMSGRDAMAVATVAPDGETRFSINFSGPLGSPF